MFSQVDTGQHVVCLIIVSFDVVLYNPCTTSEVEKTLLSIIYQASRTLQVFDDK